MPFKKTINYALHPFLSPWYNRSGWLGVKHQVTYLPTISQKFPKDWIWNSSSDIEKLDLRIHFTCWLFSTVLSYVFWQECLIEMPESVWVPLLLLGLLELCQLAYLQYWFLYLTHPRLAPSQSASSIKWSASVQHVVPEDQMLKTYLNLYLIKQYCGDVII